MISYATPHAFRAALKARCVEINARDPRLSVAVLHRQFAYWSAVAAGLSRCLTALPMRTLRLTDLSWLIVSAWTRRTLALA